MKTLTIATLALPALVASGAANAATKTFDAALSGPLSAVPRTLSLSQFDPTLGTLTGILLELSAKVSSESTNSGICNLDPSEPSGCFRNTPAEIFAFADAIISASFPGQTGPVRESVTGGATCFALADGCTATATSTARLNALLNIDPSSFDDYTGNGTVEISFFPLGDVFDSATAKVTYTFDETVAPIPLPATLPMLAVALGGAAVVRRRAKRGQEAT